MQPDGGHVFSAPPISPSNRTFTFARDHESSSRVHVSPRRCRRPTVPPLSTRTLRHPSFMPVYMAARVVHRRTPTGFIPPVPVITPAEMFYTDPTMSCGRRVPIVLTELRVLDCLRLNTPTPVMAAYPAPPSRADPFRSGTHPTRDLGSLSLGVNPLRVVVQLTQEEDQAVTNLLKLHHQTEPLRGDEAPRAGDAGRLRRGDCWSDLELEAADTLLGGFGPTERDHI
ncbi:uncharacterized protein AB9W97_008817 [Spinachia spinachia]